MKSKNLPSRILSTTSIEFFSLIPTSPKELMEKGLKFQKALTPNYMAAIECYNKMLQSNPDHIGALNNRGVSLVAQGHHDRALLDFNHILELEANNIMALNNRGSIYLAQGDYTRASTDFNRVLELDPNNANASYNMDLMQKQVNSSCCLIL